MTSQALEELKKVLEQRAKPTERKMSPLELWITRPRPVVQAVFQLLATKQAHSLSKASPKKPKVETPRYIQ